MTSAIFTWDSQSVDGFFAVHEELYLLWSQSVSVLWQIPSRASSKQNLSVYTVCYFRNDPCCCR